MPSVRIRRDVRRDEGAERRLQLHAAGQFQPRLAFGLRRAWQDAQPPAQKIRSPRVASPVPSAATVAASSLPARVSTQNAGRARAAQPAARRRRALSRSRHLADDQPFLMRKSSWQPPQFEAIAPNCGLQRVDVGGAAATAAAVSALNLSIAAWKPAMSSQIFGRRGRVAAVSLPAGHSTCRRPSSARPRQAWSARPSPARHRNRLLALDDRRDAADRLAVRLHQRLAVGDRVGEALPTWRTPGRRWRA